MTCHANQLTTNPQRTHLVRLALDGFGKRTSRAPRRTRHTSQNVTCCGNWRAQAHVLADYVQQHSASSVWNEPTGAIVATQHTHNTWVRLGCGGNHPQYAHSTNRSRRAIYRDILLGKAELRHGQSTYIVSWVFGIVELEWFCICVLYADEYVWVQYQILTTLVWCKI